MNSVTVSIRPLWAAAALLVIGSTLVADLSGQSSGSTRVPEPEAAVVTVSAQQLPIDKISASVSVISRSDIASSQADTVVELLQHTPFLYLSQVGGRGGLSAVSIRGGDPNFTLVMIDGIPLNDPTNILGGAFDLAAFSLDRVDRIEIVRGPMSVRHGSEGIAGVINIITRKGEGPPEVMVNFLGGSFDTWQLGAGSQGRLKAWHYSANVSHLEVGEQVENEDLERTSFSFASGVSLGGESALDFHFRLHDRQVDGFSPNGGGPEFSILREPQRSDVQETVFGATWLQEITGSWFQRLHFDYYNRLEDAETPPILDEIPPTFSSRPRIDSESDFERARVQFDHYWLFGSAWQAGLDLSFRHESGALDAIIADLFPGGFRLERDTWSWGGELRYALDRYQFDAGLRIDNSDDASLETSPRLGGSVRLGPRQTRIKASWAEGFKLPSFFALGEPNVGNPDLRPEKSRGFDVGIEQPLANGKGRVSLTYYRNSFTDLIDFSPEQFRLVNRSHVTTRGVEAQAQGWITDSLQLSGHVTYLDFEIEGSSEPLRDRPRWLGGIRLDWNFHRRAQLHIDNTWVGSRFDFQIPVPEQDQVGGYANTALAVSYRPARDLTLFARIDNLLDREFHHFVGFPDPGIYARFGLRYRFRLR